MIGLRVKTVAGWWRAGGFCLLMSLPSPVLIRAQSAKPAASVITIDANAAAHPLPHFWEQMFGSGRAVLALREDYRRDLRDVKQVTGFQYVRFHDILDDDIGVYDQDKDGKAILNFSYVDEIYDGLLAAGVKPFVELSFMPSKLSAKTIPQAFWYHPNVAPPQDYERWGALVEAFTRKYVAALLERTRGNQTEAARIAGLDRTYFGRLLAKLGKARTP